jgi:hypothetical protein
MNDNDVFLVGIDRDDLLGLAPVKATPCKECGTSTKKRCSACNCTYVCSKKCFKKYWPKHKEFCKRLRAARDRQLKIEHARGTLYGMWYENKFTRNKLYSQIPKNRLFQNHLDQSILRQITITRITLYKWLEETARNYGLKVDYSFDKRVTSMIDYEHALLHCLCNRNTLLPLTFDLRKEWCIIKSNEHAAVHESTEFREYLPAMHMGVWLLVFDSFAYCSLLTEINKCKATILSCLNSLNKITACTLCNKSVEDFKVSCDNCHIRCCSDCYNNQFYKKDGKSIRKCVKCGEEVETPWLEVESYSEVDTREKKVLQMLVAFDSKTFPKDIEEILPKLISKAFVSCNYDKKKQEELRKRALFMMKSPDLSLHLEEIRSSSWFQTLNAHFLEQRKSLGILLLEDRDYATCSVALSDTLRLAWNNNKSVEVVVRKGTDNIWLAASDVDVSLTEEKHALYLQLEKENYEEPHKYLHLKKAV